MLNEIQIREAFHQKKLHRHHANPLTIVIDELGLCNGKFRADIAVLNGKFTGYEIKSDADTLRRLTRQVFGYSAIFNRVSVITTNKHLHDLHELLPFWWGIILTIEGSRGGIHFRTIRKPIENPETDDHALARLLWKKEAIRVLADRGYHKGGLRERREILYGEIAEKIPQNELRLAIRDFFILRHYWRDQSQSVVYDG